MIVSSQWVAAALRRGVAVALMVLLGVDAHAAAPSVTLAAGALSGKHASVDGVALREFHGIPYAAPPVGALRWKPPQPVVPWSGVRKAQQFGPRCMQRPVFSDMVFRSNGVSEDCLYLNVWTPARTDGQKLPVLVYFYGGGYVAGDASEPRYDGASMAARGIVTVTVNYRLGVFGFLALPSLAAESPHHAAGNYGLLDQNAALHWVRQNIARFGGDPAKITIGGESAGSMSVSALMASPLSRGVIAGAIGESGALIAPLSPLPLSVAQQRGETFMAQVGADSLAALRAMPAEALLQATADKSTPRFAPDIDGYFLTEAPAATFARGAQAAVPLLLGSNSQEGSYVGLLDGKRPTPANYRTALEHLFGAQAPRALALYPGDDEQAVKRSGTALAGDMFIAHSTWRWMDLHRHAADAPVYFYYYDQPRPARRQPVAGESADAGAVHSAEIEYALGNLDGNPVYAWTADDRETSRLLQGYFAQFIKHGDPNGEGLPTWPAVAESAGGLLRQTIDAHPHSVVDKGAARQAFLQAFYAAQPGAL
jgi:para-nitrobenzyl esterase